MSCVFLLEEHEETQETQLNSDSELGQTSLELSESENEEGLKTDLVDWAVHNKITHTTLPGLLEILRKTNTDLPKDPRTLLGTTQTF